jgi:hypothetical protein
MNQLHTYTTALFGEHYTAAQLAKILINANGEQMNHKSVQNWLRGDYQPPKMVLKQLHDECEKRLIILCEALKES